MPPRRPLACRIRRPLLLALGAALAALGGAGPALGCSPAFLREGNVTDLTVAVDRAGRAIAHWLRYDQRSNVYEGRDAIRTPGGGWTAAAALLPAEERAEGLKLAFAPDGSAVAVWQSGSAVRAAIRSVTGEMGAVETLSAPGGSLGRPLLAVDAAGNALAVWIADGGGGSVLHAASRPAGGTWGPPQALSGGGGYSEAPTIAVGPGGRALVAWTTTVFGESAYAAAASSTLLAAERPNASAPFGPAVTISAHGASTPSAAVGGDGEAVILWTDSAFGPPRPEWVRRATMASERRPDGSWSPAHELGPRDEPAPYLVTMCFGSPAKPGPRVAMDPAGNATALSVSDGPNADTISWAGRAAGGDWLPGAELGVGGTAFGVSLGPAGEAIASWWGERGLRAARRTATGAFGVPEDLGSATYFSMPQIAIEADGRSFAVWADADPWPGPHHVLAAASSPAFGWEPPVDLSALVEQPTAARSEPSRAEPQPQPQPTAAPRPVRLSAVVLSGALLRFRLSAPARVRVTVQRGGRGAALRSVTLDGRAGPNRLRIARPLAPGGYLMRLRARGADGPPAARVLRLTVHPG
jgi:hypothetical protein